MKLSNGALNSNFQYTHPDEIITYKENHILTTPNPWDKSEDLRPNIIGSSINQDFDFNVGDHLLIIVAGTFNESGSRYSNRWDNDNAGSAQFFSGAPGEITIAPHGFGFNENLTTGDNGLYATPSYGFGHRCFVGYIDRENGLGRYVNVFQDGTEPYFDTFAGVTNLTQGANWNDALIGTKNIDFGFNSKFIERGSIRAIKWKAGKAPPINIIEIAMEWSWLNWAENNKPIMYPSLISYQN